MKAMQEWTEFKAHSTQQPKQIHSRSKEGSEAINGENDLRAEMRINVAAIVHENSTSVGVGWTIKNDREEVLFTGVEVKKVGQMQYIAELDIVQQTLEEANRRGLRGIEMRLDVKIMVVWLQEKISPVSEASSIVNNILLLKSSFVYCKFVYL